MSLILFNLHGEYLIKEVVYFKIGGGIVNKVRFSDDTAIIVKTQEELPDMVNRLVDTGRKYGMEINIDKSQVVFISASSDVLLAEVFWGFPQPEGKCQKICAQPRGSFHYHPYH